DVQATDITTTSVTITWTTDEPATSRVEYGTTTSYGSLSPADATLVISHSVKIGRATSRERDHYFVRGRDAAGNLSASAAYAFSTTAPDTTGPVITDVQATNITTTSVTITWTTDEPATSRVEYGTTTGYGSLSPADATLVISHSV